MTDFDKLWKFTETIPGSFTRLSGEKLYEYAMDIPRDGVAVEVGVDQGRSASLLLNAAETNGFFLTLVDSWESVLIDNMRKVEKLTKQYRDALVDIWNMPSLQAAAQFNGEIDLIHIDANHHPPHPFNDCEAWLPKLKSGGVACFHDFHPPSAFPSVTEAIELYCGDWVDLGVWDSLAIRGKP